MAHRCPSASIYCVGQLNNWELVYRGSTVNSHATIIRKHGSYVPVLLWNIEPTDEKRLDIYEGFPKYYYKQNVMVDIGGKKKKAMVYIMDQDQRPGRPSNASATVSDCNFDRKLHITRIMLILSRKSNGTSFLTSH